MDKFIHQGNLELYRRKLAEAKDQITRDTIRKLLTEEEAKDLPIAGHAIGKD